MAFKSVIGLAGVGMGMNMLSSSAAAQSEKANLGYQATMDNLNAQAMNLGAQNALFQGQQMSESLTLNAGQMIGQQTAGMDANGIISNRGGASRVTESTRIMGEADAATARANAIRNAFGYSMGAVNAQNQGNMAAASGAGINPALAAAGSALSSAGQVASSWYMMSKAGYGMNTSALQGASGMSTSALPGN
jgi:hypothetical protein